MKRPACCWSVFASDVLSDHLLAVKESPKLTLKAVMVLLSWSTL